MTAIAWKNGVLAADSRVTIGHNVVDDSTKKIYRHKQYVLAACGGSNVCAWYYAWLKSNFMIAAVHNLEEDAEAFLIDTENKKLWRVYANGYREECNPKVPIATGSAWFAVQLLMREFNMPPTKAIKTVGKYDMSINRKVRSVKCW